MRIRVYEVHTTYEVDVPGDDYTEVMMREAVAKALRGEFVSVSRSRVHAAVPVGLHTPDAREVLQALCRVSPSARVVAARQAGLQAPTGLPDEATWVVSVVASAAQLGRLGSLLSAIEAQEPAKSTLGG